MTNIQTLIRFYPRRLAALPAGLAMAPCSCRKRHGGSASRGDGITLLQPVAGAGSIVGASCQAGFLAITLGSAPPRPNPQKLLVLASDLLVGARDLTAAG